MLLASKVDPYDGIIPAVPVQPRTWRGDIRVATSIALVAAMGRYSSTSFRKVIGDDAAIDAAFLDLPYNVRISGHERER